MLVRSLTLRRIWPAFIALATAAGCGPREEISRYTASKPELIDPTLTAAPAEARPQQTLGAIVLTGQSGWFFKVTGDPKTVEPRREDFSNFVKQVRFSKGPEPQPSWELPEGWKELPGDSFRFATIEMPTDGAPLSISVSMLPLNDFSREEFVLKNVNRWRGQVGLESVNEAQLVDTSETSKIGEHDAFFVSLVGESNGGGMGAGPFAPFAGGASTAPGSSPTEPVRPKNRPSPDESGKVAYDTPDGWKAGRTDEFRQAAFTATDGGKSVEITVIPLGQGSGTLLENVNRWRGQLELPETTAAELAKITKKVETLGVSGSYVELVGPSATILGVVAEAGGRIWFVKLSGDSELAQREKPKFEAFVKSLRLQ
jgi:hypothetical protein